MLKALLPQAKKGEGGKFHQATPLGMWGCFFLS